MTNRLRLLSSHHGMRTLIEDNPHDEENPIIHESQECEPIIEAAKILSEQTPGKDYRHAAFIPRFVFNRAVREGWVNDDEAWRKWANDADNKAFRTWPGRL